MPIKLHVGLMRKVGEPNFSSRGASVQLEIELDAGCAEDAPRLQQKIRQLFHLVRDEVTAELGQSPAHAAPSQSAAEPREAESREAESPVRPATENQLHALRTIALRREFNLERLLQRRFGLALPEELSLDQASVLLDELNRPGR
jgi:hypothetical protein